MISSLLAKYPVQDDITAQAFFNDMVKLFNIMLDKADLYIACRSLRNSYCRFVRLLRPVAILPCSATPRLHKVQDGKGLFSLTARVIKF